MTPISRPCCRLFLLQKVSLILNGLFFAHLLLLYYGGVYISQSISNGGGDIQTFASGDLQLDAEPVQTTVQSLIAASPVDESIRSTPKSQKSYYKKKSNKITPKSPNSPPIYLITPTVNRPTRKADFTRLAQTVRQIPNMHWIVVEDNVQLCGSVENILKRLITNYTYLAAQTPDYRQLGFERELNKGIFQRNVALEWLRWTHRRPQKNQSYTGIVYFADDDNTYDLRLFEIMRRIKRVGVWPVALVGGVKLEKPRRDPDTGLLAGFEVGFAPNRTFAVDMAGFALGLDLILRNPQGHFPLDTVRGWNEPALFDSFDLSYDDIQVLGLDTRTPGGLLEPLVWHTKTNEASLVEEARFKKNYGYISDEGWEV